MECDPLQQQKHALLIPFEPVCNQCNMELSARLRALEEAICDLSWITTSDGQMLVDQLSWTRFTGQSFEQAKGKGWLAAVHPNDQKLLETTIAQCVQTAQPADALCLVRHVQGSHRLLSIRCVPVGSDNIYELIYLGTFLLPDQQGVSNWLRRAGVEHLETRLIDMAHDAILICDFADGRILAWNQGATATYGYSAEEAVGQIAYKLLQTRFPTSRGAFVRSVVQNGKWEGEIQEVRRDGHRMTIESRFVLMSSGEGRPLALLHVARDITERKQTEQQLKEYIQLLEAAGEVGLWTWDIVQNRGVLSLTDMTSFPALPAYKPGQIVDYEQFIQVIHPDDREATAQAIRDALEQKIDYVSEFRVEHPKQGILWYLAYGRAIYDEQEKPTRMVGITMNITKRQRIEQELQAANERLTMIIESITDSFVFLDRDWRYVYVNSTACRYIGKSRDELLGSIFWEVTTGVQDILEQNLREAMDQKKTIKFDLFDERSGRWFFIRIYPAREGITVFGSDITERKQIEEELRKNETKFRRLVEANVSGVAVGDSQGRVIEANDAYLKILGYTREEMERGEIDWRALTPPEYSEVDQRVLQEARETGVFRPYEKEYFNKQGKRVPILIAGATIEDKGDVQQHITFTIDLTRQKDLEKQREHVLHLVSHELRTPLTAINGSLQLAQRRIQRTKRRLASLDSDVEEVLLKIDELLVQSLRQTHVLNRLVDDLVESARITTEKLSLSLRRHNLAEIVQGTVADMRFTMPDREILLEDLLQNVPVLVDAGRISQVLSNFISNALKYSPHEKPVAVGLRLDENKQEARVWVRDWGPGLSPEDQERVWLRYVQGKGLQDREVKSVNLGLGLHLCRLLIQQHNGRVGVESQLSEGSTFWFSLPLYKASS